MILLTLKPDENVAVDLHHCANVLSAPPIGEKSPLGGFGEIDMDMISVRIPDIILGDADVFEIDHVEAFASIVQALFKRGSARR